MNDELFNELLTSIEEAGAIRRGEMPSACTMRYVGSVLVEITEYGKRTYVSPNLPDYPSENADSADGIL